MRVCERASERRNKGEINLTHTHTREGERERGKEGESCPRSARLKGSRDVCAEPGCMFRRRQQVRRGALPTFLFGTTSLLRAIYSLFGWFLWVYFYLKNSEIRVVL